MESTRSNCFPRFSSKVYKGFIIIYPCSQGLEEHQQIGLNLLHCLIVYLFC